LAGESRQVVWRGWSLAGGSQYARVQQRLAAAKRVSFAASTGVERCIETAENRSRKQSDIAIFGV
jgi:hypothetical protein